MGEDERIDDGEIEQKCEDPPPDPPPPPPPAPAGPLDDPFFGKHL